MYVCLCMYVCVCVCVCVCVGVCKHSALQRYSTPHCATSKHDSAPGKNSLLLTDFTDKRRCFLNCAQFACFAIIFANIKLILLWQYEQFLSLINRTEQTQFHSANISPLCTGHVAFNVQNCVDYWLSMETIGCTYSVDGEKLKENVTWPDRETLVQSSILTCHKKTRTCTSVLYVVCYKLLHIWVIPPLEKSDFYTLPTAFAFFSSCL